MSRAAADQACIQCDYGAIGGEESWAKELTPWQVGTCCAVEFIRNCFKLKGMLVTDVERFGLIGSFRDRARQVFDAGPESELGRWFLTIYLSG